MAVARMLLSLFGAVQPAPAVVQAEMVAPAPGAQSTAHYAQSPDALDCAIAERNNLLRAGFSERYASASFLARLAAELPTQTGARSMGRKLRSLAGQYMARELA